MTMLPPGFEALEPFAALWAIEGTANRAALRGSTTDAERQAFFAAASPIVPAALDYLDQRSLADFDTAERKLMSLCLSFAHVALAVETQAGDEAKHTPFRNAMIITRTPADA